MLTIKLPFIGTVKWMPTILAKRRLDTADIECAGSAQTLQWRLIPHLLSAMHTYGWKDQGTECLDNNGNSNVHIQDDDPPDLLCKFLFT